MNSNCLETLKGALLHVEKIQDERDPSGVWSVELSRFAQMLTKCITEEQKRMNNTTPAPQAWIDIKERKPEDGKICFVHFEDGGYGCQIPGNYYAILSKITHWMPVPRLPKQPTAQRIIREPQGWIDIRERKPEEGQECFVNFNQNGMAGRATLAYSVSNPVWRSVSHWLPVPPVPKQDPFEEWWKSDIAERGNNHPHVTAQEWAQRGWNAGVQWARKSQCSATEQTA